MESSWRYPPRVAPSGAAARAAALEVLDGAKAPHAAEPTTSGADKGFDGGESFQELESRGIEPHVPPVKEPRDPEPVAHRQREPGVAARPRMKTRTTGGGFRLGQKCRKKIEGVFGRLKAIAGRGRGRVVGRWQLQQLLGGGAAAFNLVRLRELKPA